ncbi:MAG: LysR substrate-binding domain-containing protein, partial [Hyphomicrobiales bacterium]
MKRAHQITLKQLRALAAVAQNRTILEASQALGITGPAVHSQLKTLEETIGSPLITRESKTVSNVTPVGYALLKSYEEITASMTRAIRDIKAMESGNCGSVTLGVVSTGKYFAPEIVAQLAKEMPDVAVTLRVGNRGTILQGIERGEYDICIMGRPPRMPVVEAKSMAPHPHIIIARPDHLLAQKKNIDAVELVDESFVIREMGSGTRILTERFFDEIAKGRELKKIEMTSNETIKQSVLSSLGIALLSAHTVANELETGRLIALD